MIAHPIQVEWAVLQTYGGYTRQTLEREDAGWVAHHYRHILIQLNEERSWQLRIAKVGAVSGIS